MGISWVFEPTINFYRKRDRLTWLAPVDRSAPQAGKDYYLVLPEDYSAVQKLGAIEMYRDPLSSAMLSKGAIIKGPVEKDTGHQNDQAR